MSARTQRSVLRALPGPSPVAGRRGRRAGMNIEEIRSLPAAVELVAAGRALGIGRDKTWQMAKDGTFPVPILRRGPRSRFCRLVDICDELRIQLTP
jgi:hypothetical protein